MKKGSLLIIATILLLTACGGTSSVTNSSSNISSNSSSQSSISSEVSSENSQTSENSYDNYYLADNITGTLRQNVDTAIYGNWKTSSSIGTNKFYIVPVQLADGPEFTQTMLDNIDTAFFGAAEETKYESVSSYFEKASYGKLHITGEVGEVYKSSSTINYISRQGDNSSDTLISEYISNNDVSNLTDYDVDGDGYIDNIIFIYSNKYDGQAFWAWCSCYSYEQTSSLKINNYMWISYDFLLNGYNDGYRSEYIDAHTPIHESGHLMGLDDYYDYSYTWDCAGLLEMQGANVGDHNIYSKLAFGWAEPYVVTGDAKITLKPSSSSPECILIKDNYSNSIFDEYLLLEYYTPTGLNEVDSQHAYDGYQCYSQSGVRVYHVDARLINLEVSGSYVRYAGYTDSFSTDPSVVTTIGASNTPSYSYLPTGQKNQIRYLSLIDRGRNNTLSKGMRGQASVDPDDTLFQTGDILTFDYVSAENEISLRNYFMNQDAFNDGTDIPYTIEIGAMDENGVEITINKIS